ncbi:MAG: phosphatase PAP2 family protein [Gemmatimonadaceae bacterium]
MPRVRWTLVAAGYATAILSGVLFALLVQGAGGWEDGLTWERNLLLRIPHKLPPAIDTVFLFVPWFGTNITLLPLIVIASVWLVVKRRRTDLAAHLVVVELGSWTLTPILKSLLERPRPELWEWRGQFEWAAFPSGHAIASVSVLFTIAILLHRERGWRWPFVAAGVLLCVSFLSRVYLGVHWPTDVIGGALIGLIWLVACLAAFPSRRDDGPPRSDQQAAVPPAARYAA